MELFIIDENNRSDYLNFLDSHTYSGVWHYPEWIDFLKKAKKIESGFNFVIKNENETIIAGTFLIYKSKFIKYGYIPAGILYKKELFNSEIYDFFIKSLKEYTKKDKITFIQMDSITPFDENFVQIVKTKKDNMIDISLPIPQYTNTIDLSKSEDEILKLMKHKGRYNIRYAEKNGIRIEEADSDKIDGFYNLLIATTSRDGFRPNSIDYYRNFIKEIKSSKLLLAYDAENELLASGIFTYTKNQALYYYGASSNNKRNLMAPYLLQWHAILIGKERGSLYYDFMGIKNPDNQNDRLDGVTDFKLKFSENIVKFNPSIRIVIDSFKYRIYSILKKLKK